MNRNKDKKNEFKDLSSQLKPYTSNQWADTARAEDPVLEGCKVPWAAEAVTPPVVVFYVPLQKALQSLVEL